MAFRNRVRLPIKLHKPQFITEREEYRRADGVTKTLSVIVRKVYDGQTDDLPEKWHEKLVIALGHDEVIIEGDKYIGEITLEGSYDIEWSEFLSRPIAQAKFKANVTPFNASNSNCGTCETYTQVVANDDNIGTVEEDEEVEVDVLANDSICCNPVTLTITTFNTTFLDSAVIVDNKIVIQLKDNLSNANGVILLVYRVECENGLYDEANVIADVEGTNPDPVCLAPTNVQLDSLDSDTSATFSWTAPSPVPDCGYHWIVTNNNGLTLLASGDTASTSVQATGLPSGQALCKFSVRSNCCDGFNSNYAGPVIFTLPPAEPTDTCGEYNIENFDFSNVHFVNYIDCNGDAQISYIPPGSSKLICALQTSPGNPVQITPSSGDINITYIDLC